MNPRHPLFLRLVAHFSCLGILAMTAGGVAGFLGLGPLAGGVAGVLVGLVFTAFDPFKVTS